MATDFNEDLLSTPSGYATPEQIKALREYAQVLQSGKGQQPVNHWSQGLSNMVGALLGGGLLRRSGQTDRASDLYDASKVGQGVEGLRPGAPDDAMAFAGPDVDPVLAAGRYEGGGATPDDGGLSAITSALRGSTGIPAPNMAPAMRVAPSSEPGGVGVTPPASGTFPHRIPVSRDELVNTLASHRLSPAIQQFVLGNYANQVQPVEAKGLGGTWIMGPDGSKRFVPDLEKDSVEGGGAKVPFPWVMGPDSRMHPITPPAGTPGTLGADVTPSKGTVVPKDQVPDLLKYADDGNPPGMLGGVPPNVASTPEERVAQLPQFTTDLLNQMGDIGAEQKGKATAAEEKAKNFEKQRQTVVDMGQRAQAAKSKLALAQSLIDDPDFVSGIFSEPRIALKRMQAWIGNNPNKAVPSETFQKIMSGDVLEEMKVLLQGLGQVRVAEINLLGQATANQHLTPEGNRAVLDLMQRSYERAENLGKLANLYSQGYRRQPDGTVIRTNQKGLDEGWNDMVSWYTEKHPIVPQSEIERYRQLLGGPAAKKPGQKKGRSAVDYSNDFTKQVQDAGGRVIPDAPEPAQGGSSVIPPPPPGGKLRQQ